MALHINRSTVVAFDLDDTLYKEIDFVRSGLERVEQHLGHTLNLTLEKSLFPLYSAGEHDPIGVVCRQYGLSVEVQQSLIQLIRTHEPNITLTHGARSLLSHLARRAVPMALVTDGRSITQRRKIEALDIARYFACIVISEEIGSSKPDERNFRHVADAVKGIRYVYIGDNPQKDVSGARALGWTTIGIEPFPGQIHYREIVASTMPKADHTVRDLAELIPYINAGPEQQSALD